MRIERARRGGLALIAAGVVAVAGCGGGGSDTLSKSEYSKKVKTVGSELQSTFQKLSTGNTKNFKVLADKLDKAGAALESSASELDDLKPPKDANADNDKLVQGMRGLASAVDDLKSAAQKKDAKALQAAGQKFQTSGVLTTLQSATSDLKKKGYDIGVLGQ